MWWRPFCAGLVDLRFDLARVEPLHPFVDVNRIGQLSDEIINVFVLNGLDDGRQGFLRGRLGIFFKIEFNAIARGGGRSARIAGVMQGRGATRWRASSAWQEPSGVKRSVILTYTDRGATSNVLL